MAKQGHRLPFRRGGPASVKPQQGTHVAMLLKRGCPGTAGWHAGEV